MDSMEITFEELQPIFGGIRIEAYFWGSASIVRDSTTGEPYIADIALPGKATDTVVTPAGRRKESGEDAVVHLVAAASCSTLCVRL